MCREYKILVACCGLVVGAFLAYYIVDKKRQKFQLPSGSLDSRVQRSGGSLDQNYRNIGQDVDVKTFDPVYTRYWPHYHYTFPYENTEGGSWPPNMHTRYYNWQPGYDTSGWSFWMRPGMSYTQWPRNRWVQKLGGHYTIDNGKDRSKDYI